MRKAMICAAICIFGVLISYQSTIAQDQKTKKVIVTGESLIGQGDVTAARQDAIDDGLRKAIEQGVGVFISSETIVENYEVIEEKITSNAKGHIKTYKMISEKQLGKRYRVSIQAIVSLETIKNDLVALSILKRQMHNPRLMIIVGTTDGKVNDAARSARVALESFAEQHFDLVDQIASNKLHNNTKLLLSVTKETVVAAKIGLEHHAEVVLTGVVSSEEGGRSNTGFQTARSKIVLRAIDPTTAKIFSSTEESANAVGSSTNEALSNSGRKSAETAAVYTSGEIVKWWQEIASMGIRYKVTLKNVLAYPAAITFEDAVQSIGGVVSLDERVFGGGFLECNVQFKGEKSKLTRAIFKTVYGKPRFEKLNVETSHGNNIIFSR